MVFYPSCGRNLSFSVSSATCRFFGRLSCRSTPASPCPILLLLQFGQFCCCCCGSSAPAALAVPQAACALALSLAAPVVQLPFPFQAACSLALPFFPQQPRRPCLSSGLCPFKFRAPPGVFFSYFRSRWRDTEQTCPCFLSFSVLKSESSRKRTLSAEANEKKKKKKKKSFFWCFV